MAGRSEVAAVCACSTVLRRVDDVISEVCGCQRRVPKQGEVCPECRGGHHTKVAGELNLLLTRPRA